MLYPLTFNPIFKERVWGGRNLERLFRKPLPASAPIGESWEISDRPGDVSVIANGPMAGRDLRWLMENHGAEMMGKAQAPGGRFPLLIKILDAEDKLSLQVHPPLAAAAGLGGEPKTEMWFIASARPDAGLYVGLRRGVTRAEFEQRLRDGSVAECFHHIAVRPGDSMFLPSGRVHAIGGGNVIFEIQQNSDTTYRVFDWNRTGLDGKPRETHVPQSLASIDFNDFEPAPAPMTFEPRSGCQARVVADDPLFRVEHLTMQPSQSITLDGGRPVILGAAEGRMTVTGAGQSVTLCPGGFCLVPASVRAEIRAETAVAFLRAEPG